MRLQVQLYIDTSGSPLNTPVYERLDVFDFESVELTSSRQEVRDIAKVFTDYSQEFSVPASARNNKILKHYYNSDLNESFDARIKQRGYITLNGITFREGFWRLSEARYRNSELYSYKLTFFGNMVELKEIIGDDELSALSGLDIYNHTYSETTVYNGFITGIGYDGNTMKTSTNRDVVYPSISATDRWFYDSSGASAPSTFNQDTDSVNLYDPTFAQGIDWTSLKPAIKAKHIISAIEQTYSSITFSDDFFGNSEFNQLYLLLHKNKGEITTTEFKERVYRIGTSDEDADLLLASGDVELRPLTTQWFGDPSEEGTLFSDPFQWYYNFTLNFTPTVGTQKYTIRLKDGDETLQEWVNQTGTQAFTYKLESTDVRVWENLYFVVTSETLTTFTISLDIEYVQEQEGDPSEGYNPGDITTISTYDTSSPSQSMLEDIIIRRHLPKLKVLDFLRGVFNMFNLTSYVDDNGVIVVKPLDDFYNDGVEIDISDKIHTDTLSISRMNLYSTINFEYQKPKTFGLINQNEVNQDDWGNLKYEGNVGSVIFDGDKYDVKLPFEKLFYDRLSDENNLDDVTPFSNGWLVNENQNRTDTAPVLFFNKPTTINTTNYKFAFKNKAVISTYNRASNTSNNELTSLNFGQEYDEYTGNTIDRSLFALYYQNYILNIFNKNTRIYRLKAKFDLGLLLTYDMNDRFLINGKKFFINNIKTNLSTGETDLELITDFPIPADQVIDVTAPSVPTNLVFSSATNTSITFTWTASTDNVAMAGYEIWVDGSLFDTVALTTVYTATGLTINTSYDIQLKAYDTSGNKSALTAIVAMSTTNVADTTPPSTPTNLAKGIVTSSSVGLTWDLSTDNVAVTEYEVYKNAVLEATVSHPTDAYNVTGLSSATSYDFYVIAKDAAGNSSAQSSTLTVTTL